MGFRFIHTADWQIGAPFGGFDADLSARLRDARLMMIEKIGDLAQAERALHVIVAGDVWDSEQPSDAMIRQPLDVMGGYSDVSWWLLPGNHDPYRNNMLWTRIAERKPDNVKLLLDATPVEAAAEIWLLPAPWTSKSPGRDLTAWMDDVTLPEPGLKIGVGHGSITDFSSPFGEKSEADGKSVIDPARAERAHLDYLALGDWHGMVEVNKRTWYSGTPETDRFKRNKSGCVLLVELEAERAPSVSPHELSSFNWKILDIDCLPDAEIFPDIDHLEMQPSLRNTLIQINLTGQITQHTWIQLEQRLRALAERADYLDIRDDELMKLVSEEDLDRLDKGGSVRMAADNLLARKNDPEISIDDRKIAGDALQLLLSFSASEGRL